MCPHITRARSRGPLKNSLLVQRGCTQRIPPEEKETCRGKGFEGEREGGKKRHYANARFRNARAEHGRDRLTRLSRISRIWRDWLIRAARTPSWYTRLWAKKIIGSPVARFRFVLKYISIRFVSRIRVTSRREAGESSSWKGGIARLINSCGTMRRDACLSDWNEANAFYGGGWGILIRMRASDIVENRVCLRTREISPDIRVLYSYFGSLNSFPVHSSKCTISGWKKLVKLHSSCFFSIEDQYWNKLS